MVAGAANAQTAAYSISDTSAPSALGNPPFTLGSEFTATTDEYVTAIGVFDSDQDGLADSYDVGLFASDGSSLATTTVDSGTTDPLVDQFRYSSITPVELIAGQTYYVGALYLTGDDNVFFPGQASNFATNPGITFDSATFAYGGTLAAPTAAYSGGPGFFGPNFLVSAVPEASSLVNTLAAISALALCALFAARRRKTA